MENKSHPTYGNGKICYIEIPSDDIRASATFYQKVFNWDIRERQDGSVSFDDAVGEVSGMWVRDRKPANEIGLLISIMVDNIQTTIDLLKASGAEILAIDTDGKEKTARFIDPSGNIFGLYQHNSQAK